MKLVFLLFCLSCYCIISCHAQGSCGLPCSSAIDCSSGLICTAKGKCNDDPAAFTSICPSPCKFQSIVYQNKTFSQDQCAQGRTYLYTNCSPPVEKENEAILYYIDLSSSTVKCTNQSYNSTEMVASMATGWFNHGSSCGKMIKIHANGSSVLARVVDECDSNGGCTAEYDFYVPCPSKSLGATTAVWTALGYNISQGVIQVTWSFPEHRKKTDVVVLVTSVGGSLILVVILAALLLAWLFLQRRKSKKTLNLQGFERVLPLKFKFQELVKATNNFSEKLGEGGFGEVFKGQLSDGTLVAVKRTQNLKQLKPFKTELMSIGTIHHVNLVKLLGYCMNSYTQILVYEFVSNGSLEKWMFSKGKFLDWSTRVSIAIDVASGLVYLHDGCHRRILHLDIKPQNILLDNNMRAKIADFGMAKLLGQDRSNATTTVIRGTLGYMAPEWLHSRVTQKTDVYSFGVLLMQFVCSMKPMQMDFDMGFDSTKVTFNSIRDGNLVDLVDRRLTEDDGVSMEDVKEMTRIGLLCVQEEPMERPTMQVVLKMLEGIAIRKENNPCIVGTLNA